MIPTSKLATLITVLDSYNKMTLDNSENCDYGKEGWSMFHTVNKFCRKQHFKLNQFESHLATAYFEKIKQLDIDLFEDKLFSPPVLVIHILWYLRDEVRYLPIVSRFGHYNFKAYLQEIDASHIRKEADYQAIVFEKFLEAWSEVLKEEKAKLEEKRGHILDDKMAS
jgi:hypothetical protein